MTSNNYYLYHSDYLFFSLALRIKDKIRVAMIITTPNKNCRVGSLELAAVLLKALKKITTNPANKPMQVLSSIANFICHNYTMRTLLVFSQWLWLCSDLRHNNTKWCTPPNSLLPFEQTRQNI